MCLAIPGKVAGIEDPGLPTCKGPVDFGGVTREVNLALVPGVKVGDYVLVHVGVALSVVDEEEAGRIFEFLEMLDEPLPGREGPP